MDFLLTLAKALHTAGTASHRLEEILGLCATTLDLPSQFFSTPTSIFASFGEREDHRTYFIRVFPSDTDLGRLSRLERIAGEVMRGACTPADGVAAVEAVEGSAGLYGPGSTVLAFGAASGAAALFLGGGWPEILAGTAVGILIGFLAVAAHRIRGLGKVFEPISAFGAAFAVGTAGALGWPVSAPLATVAGLIVLIPGYSLTTAMAELSTRHLSSGTARLSGAFIVFLGIGFGVALGTRLAGAAFGGPALVSPTPLPAWAIWGAIFIAAAAFTVLLKAELRDFGWIALSGILAFLGARVGATVLGPELGMFLGALGVGIGSNLYSHITGRPASVPLVPGVLMLVPGSIGFRSVLSLLDREVVSGVETAFQMILVATALVAGLLVANVVSSERPLNQGRLR